jgi:ABC-type phosphate/phosphonate transport system substrate-binding protein
MARLLLSIAALLAGLSGAAFGQTSPASEVAPGGKLRVGMIAITVLGGVAEPVARFVGQKLSAAVEPVMYPNPEAYLQSFGKGEWDIAIGPRVLAPADKADSTANLWAISLVYVVGQRSEGDRLRQPRRHRTRCSFGRYNFWPHGSFPDPTYRQINAKQSQGRMRHETQRSF